MSDLQESAPNGAGTSDLSNEIGRSVGAVWQRHGGGRPSSITTEFKGDVVTCTMHDAVSTIGIEVDDEAEGDGAKDDDGPPRSPNSNRYRNEAMATMRRLTGRKVLGFIPKRNKQTDAATDVYVLEEIRIKR